MREALAYVSRRDGSTKETVWVFLMAGMTASLFYFTQSLSYNLLVLCATLVYLGLLLRILDRSAQPANARMIS